jgi:hypothetical protein
MAFLQVLGIMLASSETRTTNHLRKGGDNLMTLTMMPISLNHGIALIRVWDTGTFRNITKRDGQPVPLDQAIENGQLAIWLEGKKLKGGFALTTIRVIPRRAKPPVPKRPQDDCLHTVRFAHMV